MPHTEWRGGTCRVKWWTGEYLPNGRKRYESKAGFTDEEVALDYGRDREYEVRHGLIVTNRDGATPMSEWLDTWVASLDLAHLTEKNYKSRVDAHIRPYFRNYSVADIDVLTCRAFKKYLSQALGAEASRGNVWMILGMVMDDAVAAGLRTTSPVERKGRRGKYVRKRREKKRPLLIETVDRLARNAEIFWGYRGYVFVWTMACTGMRPAELYGLTREYCHPNWPAAEPDLEEREEGIERYQGDRPMPAIRVARQIQYKDGELQFFPPKYESYRSLVVPPFLAEMLATLLASHDHKWVFPALWGGCLGAIDFDSDYWRHIADGLPPREGPRVRKPRRAIPEVPQFKGKRLYLLRHGHKEWLDEDGHSRVAVETRMGHELPGVEGTYSNMTPEMERRIAGSLQLRWVSYQERVMQEALEINSQSSPTINDEVD